MAKRASKLKPGTNVRVVAGQTMPEYDSLSIAGWVGMVLEARGRGDGLKYIIEWNEETISQIPAEYAAEAETRQIATDMACLPADAVEPVE